MNIPSIIKYLFWIRFSINFYSNYYLYRNKDALDFFESWRIFFFRFSSKTGWKKRLGPTTVKRVFRGCNLKFAPDIYITQYLFKSFCKNYFTCVYIILLYSKWKEGAQILRQFAVSPGPVELSMKIHVLLVFNSNVFSKTKQIIYYSNVLFMIFKGNLKGKQIIYSYL